MTVYAQKRILKVLLEKYVVKEMIKEKSVLQQMRESKNLTQREFSEQSGVNLRTLQDYEQGHKKIASAKAETIFRMSTVLGCTMEDLLLFDSEFMQNQAIELNKSKVMERLWSYYCLLAKEKEDTVGVMKIFSSKYKVHGRIKRTIYGTYLLFGYNEEMIALPFDVKLTEKALPWIEDAAVLKIESYIRTHRLEKVCLKAEEQDYGS